MQYIPRYDRLRLAQEYFRVDNRKWDESRHPRDNDGRFTSRVNRDKIREKKRKALELPKEEYSKIMHELNTNLTKEERKKKQVSRPIGNYIYTVINKGFNEYIITDKRNIDELYS